MVLGAAAGERLILALETSCDDTCAAVVTEDRRILSNVLSSQARFHNRYGGVVPEVASRHHLELINAVVESALKQAKVQLADIDRVAVTAGPGLIGALLVGVATAKALASAVGIALVPVNHLYGHLASNFAAPDPFHPPFVCLTASGGHTLMSVVRSTTDIDLLGQTLDDAAGEAFDKGARLLGLPYPGGAELEALASSGSPDRFEFPIGLSGKGSLDFSYSGLKTALAYRLKQMSDAEVDRCRAQLAASYQEAICLQLLERARAGLKLSGLTRLAVVGGVASNGRLREMLSSIESVQFHAPPLDLCTDNAAMIGVAATYLQEVPFPEYLNLDAFSTEAAYQSRLEVA